MNLKNLIIMLLILIWLTSWCEDRFHFAVLSDRTGGADQVAYEQVVSDIINLYPDLVVTVGDIIEDGIFEDWEVVLDPLKGLNCPIYFTPGNNDIIDLETEDNYRKMTGFEPYHSFTYLNSHFIVLDNSRFDNYSELGENQISWLINDLETNKEQTNIFIFMHKPFWADAIAADKTDSLHSLFLNYNVKAVFTGHWHHYAHEVIDGIEYYICGSSGGTFGDLRSDQLAEFYQYLWCYVEENKLHVTLMKSGTTFPKDQKNLEELNFTYRIPGNYIQTECSIIDNDPLEQNLAIKIINMNDDIIKSEIEIIPNEWQISQTNIPVFLEAFDTLKIDLQMQRLTSELTFPSVKFNYPFGNNKFYPYQKTVLLNRTLASSFTNELPCIDGVLENQQLGKNNEFSLINVEGSSDNLVNSIYFLHNDSALYLAVQCEIPDPALLKANGKSGENTIFNDDNLGFLLSHDGDNFTQFYVNALGNYWFLQSKNSSRETSVLLPDDFQSATAVNGNIWTLELKVPYALMKVIEPEKIRINFRKHLNQPLTDQFLIPEWSYRSVNSAWIILN
ncbi:metallophosphoesterase [Candidatus Cloacimonadota bacterium]